jgi:hypothetical protein
MLAAEALRSRTSRDTLFTGLLAVKKPCRGRTRTVRVACLGSTAPLPWEYKAGGLRLFASTPHAPPHPRRSEVEAFRNSRRPGLTTTVRWSIPAFLLQTPGGAPSLR